MEQKPKKLLFVYNAESGLLNKLNGFFSAIFAKSGHNCNLAKQTYGKFFMKSEWKHFVSKLDKHAEFVHKDKFQKMFPLVKSESPAVFLRQGHKVERLVVAEEINQCTSLDELMDLMVKKLSN